MSLATLNPTLPPMVRRPNVVNVSLAPYLPNDSPDVRAADAPMVNPECKKCGNGDLYNAIYWHEMKRSLAAGAANSLVDKYIVDTDDKMFDMDMLKTFGLQTAASFVAQDLVGKVVPNPITTFKTDRNLMLADSLMTGALYLLGSKLLGKDKNYLKMFLASAITDYGSRMYYGSVQTIESK